MQLCEPPANTYQNGFKFFKVTKRKGSIFKYGQAEFLFHPPPSNPDSFPSYLLPYRHSILKQHCTLHLYPRIGK